MVVNKCETFASSLGGDRSCKRAGCSRLGQGIPIVVMKNSAIAVKGMFSTPDLALIRDSTTPSNAFINRTNSEGDLMIDI